MKWWKFFSIFFLCMLLAGCTGLSSNSFTSQGKQVPTVIFSPTDCDSLLACLEESRELSRNDFKAYYKHVSLDVEKKRSRQHSSAYLLKFTPLCELQAV